MVSAVLLLLAAHGVDAIPSSRAEAAPVAASADLPLLAEKKWAVCVGAGAYTSDLAPLKYASADARAFADVLEKGYGFEPSTVGLLTDRVRADQSGTVNVPTSANILREIDRLVSDRRLDRGDLFVFYFSGHGIGTAGGDFLMPTDVPEAEATTRGVPVRSVIERFVKAGLKNVLVVADACRSGQKNPFGRELQTLGRQANIAVLLGCAPGQRSYEVPRLGNGVFTHFLVKAMTDRSLTDPRSGALWASAVASKVTEQVRSYTEADHPDDPQIPAAWSEATQDVLMAAYPPAQGSAWIGETLRTEGGRLPREAYARFLSTTGRTLEDQARSEEAIQALKTLDGLGLATWRDLLALVRALVAEDRRAETASMTLRALREPDPTDYSEAILLLDQPDRVGAARYRRALERVAAPEIQGFPAITLRVSVEKDRLGLSDAEIGKSLASYVALYPPDSAEGCYLRAVIALGEGRPAEATVAAKAALAAPGGMALRADLRALRLSIARAAQDDQELDTIFAEGEADPTDRFPWALQRLRRMKEREDPGFLAAARAFAAKTDHIGQFSELVELLGPDAGTVLADARRLAEGSPYSARAAVSLWLAQGAERGFLPVEPLPEVALKYAVDRTALIRGSLFEYGQSVESARERHVLHGWRAAEAQGDLVTLFAQERAAIGDDSLALTQMGLTLLRTGQTFRQRVFLINDLWPRAQKTEYARKEMTLTSLYLAVNSGDDALAREIFDVAHAAGFLSGRTALRYAVHQALIGDANETERALAIWNAAGGAGTNLRMREYEVAVKAMLAARRGDQPEVLKLLKRIERADEVSGPLAYLASFEVRGRKAPAPEMIAAIGNPVAEYADLHAAMIAAVAESLAAQRSPEAQGALRAMTSYLSAYTGHVGLAGIGIDGADSFPEFAGRTVFRGRSGDGVEGGPVVLSLETSRFGVVQGTVELPDSSLNYRVKGEISRYGDLDARMVDDQNRVVGWFGMKMPPPTYPVAKEGAKPAPFAAEMVNSGWRALSLDLNLVEARTLAAVPPARGKTPPMKRVPVKKPMKGGKGG